MRVVLHGLVYVIELMRDGTGMVRLRDNGAPVALLTSMATEKITASSRDLIERLATEAIQNPAPWSNRDLARNGPPDEM